MSSINSVVNLDTLIEFIWSQYEWMIKTSNMTVINIPGHIVDFIGDRGVNSIAHSFRFAVLHVFQNPTPVTNL